MPAFFKPWRRKIGVVTLALACVFAAGWVRTQVVIDRARLEWGIEPSDSLYFWSRFTLLNSIELTMLSAYLLLSKPRSANKPDAFPPPEPDHA